MEIDMLDYRIETFLTLYEEMNYRRTAACCESPKGARPYLQARDIPELRMKVLQ